MSDIEKAIDDLETWYQPTTEPTQRKSALESLAIIYEALKEKAERDKGCDQCQHYVNDFNFCPNCGRKLTKEEST